MLRYLILILFLPLLTRHQEKKPVRILKTGWYYISEPKNEYQRQLDRSKETYYIDPNPIVTANHFKDIEMSSDALQFWKPTCHFRIYSLEKKSKNELKASVRPGDQLLSHVPGTA